MKHKLIVLLISLSMMACNDQWLEAKRDLNTVLPSSLEDLDAILHINTGLSLANDMAAASLVSSDDYYTTTELVQELGEVEFNLHTWAPSLFITGTAVPEWNDSYEQVFYANMVLEKLNDIPLTSSNVSLWNRVRGGALFFRAKSFFNLARLFAPPYDVQSAEMDKGIPLRLVTDPNVGYARANVAETYELILSDLKEAASLLETTPDIVSSPSKPAAYGLLARIYLSMREYDEAGLYADSCLKLYDTLMDFNDIQEGGERTYPFDLFNPEVISHGLLMVSYSAIAVSIGFVNPELFETYEENDLRRTLFFRSTGGFRGSYTAANNKFGGIATDEILLIRAECAAREGRSREALADINQLLSNRYKEDTFIPFSGLEGETLLSLILMERRKELVFRGERWSDLRRLNQEPGHETTLYRDLDGVQYELLPGDPRYTFPIPEEVIRASGIPQNKRKQ